MNLKRIVKIIEGLITLGVGIVAMIGLALIIHMLSDAPDTEGSPTLEVTLDSEHGVLCWTNTHHSGMSCLPEWMLIPSRYDSIPSISSANMEDQLNGQKDSIAP